MKANRLPENPIIYPEMDDSVGHNINGPSLIKVPNWIKKPLGNYYLYFASHDGDFIRLAYSDSINGPWSIFKPGVLPLSATSFHGHIASPDVLIDQESQSIRLYFHGSNTQSKDNGAQSTNVAISSDGQRFTEIGVNLGPAYFRVFKWRDRYFALAMPGEMYTSENGMTEFSKGHLLFPPGMRHSAVCVEQHTLSVYFSNIGDCPEQIYTTTIDLKGDWHNWKIREITPLLAPEMEYEGGNLPNLPSQVGLANGKVRQLRDPAIFIENKKKYLLYSVAGESGIAIAELVP